MSTDTNFLGNKQDILKYLNARMTGYEITEANDYFNKIQQNIGNIQILCEIFLEMDENNILINHVITSIFGLLKSNMYHLLSTNEKDIEIYRKVKILILNCIKNKYFKMNNPNKIIRKNISDSLTLIILSGIIYHWTTAIQDLIKECSNQGNLEYIYIVLRALGSIDYLLHYRREISEENYEDSIKISQKDKIQIKEKLIQEKNIVINFLLNIYNNINNIENENFRRIMISQLFDTTKCWTNFELNIFKNENLSKMIYTIINSNMLENPENFSEMICDIIKKSHNSKITKDITTDRGETPAQLSQRLFKSIDFEEKKGMELLLSFLLPKLEELKIKNNNLNEYESKLFKEYSKILASIIENYIYLFFNFSDKRSEMILGWFNYFLKYKKRAISYLFFEGLNVMREFINEYYRFSGLSNSQKIDFVNYLMDIVYGVMENCSYNKLDQKDISLLEQEILCKNFTLNSEPPKSLTYLGQYQNEYLEENDDLKDIDINTYRSNAESVFYNIFLILLENFQDPGTCQFLNKILSSLQLNKLNEQSYLYNPITEIKIDVVFFVIFSIIDIFEIEEAPNSIKIIHNLIKEILNTKIIFQNQRIFIDFLVLINKFTQKLVLDKDNLNNVMKFLILISKNSNNQNIEKSCYIVLFNICYEINDEMTIDNSFILEFYNIYQNIYNKYQFPNIKPLQDIIDIILILSGVNKNIINNNKIDPKENNKYNPNLINVIQQISYPINNEIKNLLDKVENNNQDKKQKLILKFEIVKGYTLQGKILESLENYSIDLRDKFLKDHLNKTLNLTKKIFELFQNDEEVLNPLLIFYSQNANAIGECCKENFNEFNNIMLNYYLSSESHFKVLRTLKLLYFSIILSIDKKDNSYLPKNKYILDQYSIIMNTFINNISKLNNINSKITENIKEISDFHYYLFPKFNFNSPLLNQNNELINYYNLIQMIINFFINCMTLFQNLDKEPINEIVLVSIIKSFNTFFINFSLSKDFLIKNNNNNSCIFIELIISLWDIIFFKLFNCSARKELINCYFNAIQYDSNYFCAAFEKCISQKNKIPKNYIKPIIEYIQCFQNDSDLINRMLDLIIDNFQGNAQLDAKQMSYYLSLVARKKLVKKVNK